MNNCFESLIIGLVDLVAISDTRFVFKFSSKQTVDRSFPSLYLTTKDPVLALKGSGFQLFNLFLNFVRFLFCFFVLVLNFNLPKLIKVIFDVVIFIILPLSSELFLVKFEVAKLRIITHIFVFIGFHTVLFIDFLSVETNVVLADHFTGDIAHLRVKLILIVGLLESIFHGLVLFIVLLVFLQVLVLLKVLPLMFFLLLGVLVLGVYTALFLVEGLLLGTALLGGIFKGLQLLQLGLQFLEGSPQMLIYQGQGLTLVEPLALELALGQQR